MVGSCESKVLEVEPWSPLGRAATDAYFSEVNQRFGRPIDVAVARAADDATLVLPRGRFFVRVRDGVPIVCGGFFTAEPGVAEIKRLWVSTSERGKGLASSMLHQLETSACGDGHSVVQLDVNEALIEALALYKRSNYVEVPAFNDNAHAHFWFQKHLSSARVDSDAS